MPSWRRSSNRSSGSASGSTGTPTDSPSPSAGTSVTSSPSPSMRKRWSLTPSKNREAATELATSASPSPGSRIVSAAGKGVPTVSVSPPEAANDATSNSTDSNDSSSPSHQRGRSSKDSPSSSSSSPSDELGSQPPSMTTGSTSASIESLESIQDLHQRSVAKAALIAAAASGGTNKLSGGVLSTPAGNVVIGAGLGAAAAAEAPTSHSSSADGSTLVHSEFGYCANPAFRYESSHKNGSLPSPHEEEPPYYTVLTTYLSYAILIVVGHIRDFLEKRFYPSTFTHLVEINGYAPLNSDFDSFYTRRLKHRLEDCFARPVTGVCGRTVTLLDRTSQNAFDTFELTGEKTRCLNVSAYNYLGFAQSHGACADAVERCLNTYGVSSYGSRLGVGALDLQAQAEKLVAQFVGKQDCCVVSMGFATNSTTIPAIAGPGALIISDEYNHSSIRFGARLTGAAIRQYKHNDMEDLEHLLRECISQGMPRTHRPWKKIFLMVEGLYSMEGTLVNLPKVLELKDRYKFYLYIDEAHSIGAIGPRGRGVCDYFGVDPARVDILMGTFTKSFGAAGGYICGDKSIIDRVRLANHANVYGETLSPPVLTQIISSMAGIMGVGNAAHEMALLPSFVHLPPRLLDGSEGRERLRRLAFNARYLSSGLRKLGFIVYGHRDSPIVPLLIFNPAKMQMFSRMMLDRSSSVPPSRRLAASEKDLSSRELARLNDPASAEALHDDGTFSRPPIVVVVVAYPATPLISSRVRFCVSASHTKSDIDDVLRASDEIGEALHMKIGTGAPGRRWTIDEVTSRSLELVHWNGTDAI
ncbi:PLP-dependent transferase [Ceraceosorus guamensis]|uniref:serine C-palmitoyltransferase n=1 Tax=Ceraceosorus guamensis TaxID=1522189 RepID=A0A316VSS5_9BASI|nr:PLP-dependent transferase [Ceraceosorus guamensis]PWN40689.1 PLP-dependent transferase [Ceraceosorus guamensis]